jgi:hypothetical protein
MMRLPLIILNKFETLYRLIKTSSGTIIIEDY